MSEFVGLNFNPLTEVINLFNYLYSWEYSHRYTIVHWYNIPLLTEKGQIDKIMIFKENFSGSHFISLLANDGLNYCTVFDVLYNLK